jgi:hypothetical protein
MEQSSKARLMARVMLRGLQEMLWLRMSVRMSCNGDARVKTCQCPNRLSLTGNIMWFRPSGLKSHDQYSTTEICVRSSKRGPARVS